MLCLLFLRQTHSRLQALHRAATAHLPGAQGYPPSNQCNYIETDSSSCTLSSLAVLLYSHSVLSPFHTERGQRCEVGPVFHTAGLLLRRPHGQDLEHEDLSRGCMSTVETSTPFNGAPPGRDHGTPLPVPC